MSGLYNIMFGYNPLAGTLLSALGVNQTISPRFRDCFLNEDGTEIIIYTRTGGGNRSEYEAANRLMQQIAGYIGNEDDSADSTYALFRYAVPEQYREVCVKLAPLHGVNPTKRWKEVIEDMGKK